MAAAEARAAIQRTVNRCFVQEDAKRAPRLACCQSSSSSSKQFDSGPANPASDGPDQPSIGFMPFRRSSSSSSLFPESKWWLHTQSCVGYQKIFTPQHSNSLETANETSKSGTEKSSTSTEIDDYCGSSFDTDHGDSQECLGSEEMKTNFECLDKDSFISKTVSKHEDECYFDPDCPWIKEDKGEPWWWITDKDELAYWVAHKSLHHHVQNCDLPPPKKSCFNFNTPPYAQSKSYEHDANWGSTLESNHRNCEPDSCCFRKTRRKLSESIEHGNLLLGSLKSSCVKCSCTNLNNLTKTIQTSEDNASKVELMDALLHSQTRAREAEIAAKRAYAEKENIVELFFRQASQLFAYRQWFQLLQLEGQQMKNKDRPRFTRKKRVKRDRHRSDISTYAVAIALGLSLVSAGLLLGWTIGWMLPSF